MFARMYKEKSISETDEAWKLAKADALAKGLPEPWEFAVRAKRQHELYWEADKPTRALVDAAIEEEHKEALVFWEKYQKIDTRRADLQVGSWSPIE